VNQGKYGFAHFEFFFSSNDTVRRLKRVEFLFDQLETIGAVDTQFEDFNR